MRSQPRRATWSPLDQARSLGIEKGKPFNPDEAMRSLLKKAAAEAQQELIRGAMNNKPWWPGKRGVCPTLSAPKPDGRSSKEIATRWTSEL
jgi:hypothetical protein